MGNTTTRESFQVGSSLTQAVGGKPIPCPPGTYGGSTGQSTNQCSGKCSAGYYCTQASTSPTQNECPPGYYCLEGTGDPLSQNPPTPCIAGTTSGPRATSCTACGDGTSSVPGGQCTPCLANTYSVNACGAAAASAAATAALSPIISPAGPTKSAPPDVQLWFDGNDPAGNGNTLGNGESINTWADKSGNARNATATGGPTPVFTTNVANGLGAIRLRREPSNAAKFRANFPPGTFSAAYQIFIVTENQDTTFGNQDTDTCMYGTNLSSISFGLHSMLDLWDCYRSFSNHQQSSKTSTNMLQNRINMWQGLLTQNTSPTSYTEWRNGTSVPITDQPQNASGFKRISEDSNISDGTVYIGGADHDNIGWTGYIHEVVVYNRKLSDAERTMVEGYLAWKWGFQAYLATGHPYKLTSPGIERLTSPPFKPLGLTATISSAGIIVNWTAGNGGTSYSISISSNTNEYRAQITGNNATTGTVAGVKAGDVYNILVTATNQFGSTPSDSIIMTIPNITVSTIAGSIGSTTAAIDGLNGAAFISKPMGIVADSCGSLFVAEYGNNYIRKIYLQPQNSSTSSASSTTYPVANIVTTFAGTGAPGFVNSGSTTTASFNLPQGLAIDSTDTLYVADTYNHSIRKITPQGVVTTLAGSGNAGMANGTGAAASFRYPTGVAVDSARNVYVTDKDNHLIRKITPAGVVSTLAGSGSAGSTDGTGASATFNGPWSLATDSTGNVFVTDTNNHTIRRITPAGVVTTIAGTGGMTGTTNGVGACARFNSPVSLAFDSNGSLYVCERFGNLIRKIAFTTPSSASVPAACVVSEISMIATVTTIAGTGVAGYGNGISLASQFNAPYGICFDSTGVLYVADSTNNVIRGITILPAAQKAQPSSCATLCNPCCAGTLSSVGASSCSPYPGYIINTSRVPYFVNRGFYQNDTNGTWAGYFTSALPVGLPGNMVLTATGQFPTCTLHLFPGWIAFGYLNKNPVNKMVLDPTPYTGSSTIRSTTYVLVILSQSEVSYTTGTTTESMGSRGNSVAVPNVLSRGSGLPTALPLFVCGNGSASC